MHPDHIVVPQRDDQRSLIRRLAGPVGTAVIAVLVLRASGEWRDFGDRRSLNDQ